MPVFNALMAFAAYGAVFALFLTVILLTAFLVVWCVRRFARLVLRFAYAAENPAPVSHRPETAPRTP